MKKALYISALAIIMIGCLQGYNIYLQYKNYVETRLAVINKILYQSIDEECSYRSQTKYKEPIGSQHLRLKVYDPGDKIPASLKKEPVIKLNTFDIKKLKNEGLVDSQADLLTLINQDMNEAKGHPINLSVLDKIFRKNLKEADEHSILILNKDKKVIKTYGRVDVPSSWISSKDYAISLSHPRFVRVVTQIPPSLFIWHSIGTLVLSLLFVLVAAICIGYQLREIKRKDELLKNRELSVNSVIHDLKAPINSIIMLMSVIKMKLTDANMLQLVEQTTDKAKRLVNTIETILLTADEKRRIILSPEETDIIELANIAKSDVDILYKDKKHSIVLTDETVGKAMALVDRMYMLNVLRNLMENAVKYADIGVSVSVSVCKKGAYLQVRVADDGWGISPKDQKRIFQQFYRVPHKQGPKGNGIGLALVKYVVEAHGGHITVESELGKGSTFTLDIPC